MMIVKFNNEPKSKLVRIKRCHFKRLESRRGVTLAKTSRTGSRLGKSYAGRNQLKPDAVAVHLEASILGAVCGDAFIHHGAYFLQSNVSQTVHQLVGALKRLKQVLLLCVEGKHAIPKSSRVLVVLGSFESFLVFVEFLDAFKQRLYPKMDIPHPAKRVDDDNGQCTFSLRALTFDS